MKMKANTVCALSSGIYFYGLLAIQSKKNCQIVEEVCTMTEQVVNSKDLRRQTKERMAVFFHKMCGKYYRKSCKYMRNNSTKQKGKNISTSQYRSKLRAQRYGDKLPKNSRKALKRKRRCTLHASMLSEGFANFIPKEDWPANSRNVNPPRDHLDYRRREDIQRSSPQNTGRAKTLTTLRLEESDFGHALGARTFYTSPLKKCQKTYGKTFWLLIF